MALQALLILIVVSVSPFVIIESTKLSLDYYRETCPDFAKIIHDNIESKQFLHPAIAPGTLRLFFHDCMVEGCDASVLISSNEAKTTERDADANHSLSDDAFDVVVSAKATLEQSCPGIVSCADILAQTTRDLVTKIGGPFYKVLLGRKDGLLSEATNVEGNIPRPNQTMDQLIRIFESRGLTIYDMVALNGAHTIGFSHCKEFSDRLFHFNKTNPTDPDLNPLFATTLKITCENIIDLGISVVNDLRSPLSFDNMYYKNLNKGFGLLRSDNALVKDPRTKPIAESFAADQKVFFRAFSQAMEKLSVYNVKTGQEGEVRLVCDAFN
ncbi:peroxidase 65-like [Humulus lupulus]|uniref:peroxidase 65-like n=1 Tax=Humulus lupulus TaxID=3486 RepID=UPI002B4032E5|nr:peroxidase 65-like [Humulus lupulus]